MLQRVWLTHQVELVLNHSTFCSIISDFLTLSVFWLAVTPAYHFTVCLLFVPKVAVWWRFTYLSWRLMWKYKYRPTPLAQRWLNDYYRIIRVTAQEHQIIDNCFWLKSNNVFFFFIIIFYVSFLNSNLIYFSFKISLLINTLLKEVWIHRTTQLVVYFDYFLPKTICLSYKTVH